MRKPWGEAGVRIRDSVSGKPLIPVLEHKGQINGAMFTGDEKRILTWGETGVRIWDSIVGKPLTPVTEYKGSVKGAMLSNDENRLLTWNTGGVQVFDIKTDTAWPHNKMALKAEVDTGRMLEDTDELIEISADAWQKKKWCEYDAIQYRLGRISEEEWLESQRLCEQLKSSETE